jgi:hypothetical protein
MKKTLLILVTAICSFNCFAQLPSWLPADGLIAWYPFHGNTKDESGNKNNGTNNGAVITTDRFGKAKDAYSFNGTNSYISVPSSASLESPTKRLTMSAWVNLAGVSLAGDPWNPILSKTNSITNSFMYAFAVFDNPASSLYAVTNSWSTNTSASYNFALNKWYMVTVVLDSIKAYFYVNGSLVSTNTFATNIVHDTRPLTIGSDPPGENEVCNGKLDDIAIWNRALTGSEVKQLYLACYTPLTASISSAGTTTFCAGSDVLLTATPNLYAAWQWKKDGSDIAGATKPTYSAKETGNYSCVINNACGAVTSNKLKATKLDLGNVSISTKDSLKICAGNSVTFTATNPGAGYTYQWYRNDVSIIGATALTYKAYSAGTYKIIITNTANGCSRNSGTKKVVVNNCLIGHIQESQSLTQVVQNNINIYPNPVSNSFTFKLDKNVSGIANITLSDMLGQEVFENKSEIENGLLMRNISINNRVHSGMYILRIKVNERMFTGKVVVQ